MDGPYFSVVQVVGKEGLQAAPYKGPVQVIPLAGQCSIAGQSVGPGQSGWASSPEGIDFEANERSLLVFNPTSELSQPVLP